MGELLWHQEILRAQPIHQVPKKSGIIFFFKKKGNDYFCFKKFGGGINISTKRGHMYEFRDT